jgi:hypothetical protein
MTYSGIATSPSGLIVADSWRPVPRVRGTRLAPKLEAKHLRNVAARSYYSALLVIAFPAVTPSTSAPPSTTTVPFTSRYRTPVLGTTGFSNVD